LLSYYLHIWYGRACALRRGADLLTTWAPGRLELDAVAKRRPPDPANMEIGRRMRAAREALRLTQLEVATELGISEATYGRREAGLIKLSVPALERTARILGLAPESLLPGAAPPAPAVTRQPLALLRELEAYITHQIASEEKPDELEIARRINRLPPRWRAKVLRTIARAEQQSDPPPTP
jgi:transcriptional regulator with XRE-family HTH domain